MQDAVLQLVRTWLPQALLGELARHFAGEGGELFSADAELLHLLAALVVRFREMHPLMGDLVEHDLEGDLVAAGFGQVLHGLISFIKL